MKQTGPDASDSAVAPFSRLRETNWTRPAQGAPSAAAQLPVRTMACAATSRQEVSHASATRPWSSCRSHPPAECSGPQALINRGDDKRLRCARGRRGAGSSSCSAAVDPNAASGHNSRGLSDGSIALAFAMLPSSRCRRRQRSREQHRRHVARRLAGQPCSRTTAPARP